MNQDLYGRKKGFTLIEIIITIVFVAVLAAMMIPYFGKSLTQSSNPLARLATSMTLNETMENITAEYNNRFQHWRPNYTYAAGATVLPTTPNVNGYQYQTSGGGTSGSPTSEPSWKLPGISRHTDGVLCTNPPDQFCTMINDGSVTWYLAAVTPVLATFQSDIGAVGDHTQTFNNKSCTYSVINNKFIKFDPANSNTEVDLTGNTTDPEYGRYLKVTIGFASTDANRTAESITTLFGYGNH
jgi:prepilin-type N-terminal cleavage/methylation domain-containing protein